MPSRGHTPLPMPAPRFRWRFGHPFALMVLLLSLVFVLVAWSSARERERQLAEAEFQNRAGNLVSLVRARLTSFELTLRGGSSLFAALKWPAPEHWRIYVDGLALDARFPSLTGLGFAAYADPGRLANLQLLIRDTGSGRFNVHPHGRRPQYGPIVYLEPRTPENLLAVGYDMYSEPVRRAAMDAAMESGQARMSGLVHLVQDGGRPVPGLLLYAPVYDSVLPPADASRRRATIKGWVYAPFRMAIMLKAAIAPAQGSERMRVVDVTAAAPVVLYEDPGIDEASAFRHSQEESLYGRRWRFDFHSGPEREAAPQLAAIDRLLLAGIATSLLLFALAWMLGSTEARAQRIAEDMTASYRRSEQRFRNSMRYSPIGKALLDAQGNIVEVNPSFSTIVGRDAGELAGQPLAGLLDDVDSHPLRTAQMDAVLDDEGGVVRTTRTLHRGGELRHVQLAFAPVPEDPATGIVRMVQLDDVTQRVRAEAAVQALNRTLEARVAARTRELSEANRELESFAYSVSHDLRAPLRAIEGFSSILVERHAGALDATGRAYLERVRKATARMGELIDALLKLSRIGRSGLNLAEVDLSALAEEVGAGLADAEPGHRVDLRVQPGMRVLADRALLETLLDNLLGNAWKFSRHAPQPRVEVGMQADAEGGHRYFIRDNGAGFDPGYADKLFRPFQRLHGQDEFPGHGIGLASVKRIVERHGGRIGASGTIGQGAEFWFTLGDPVDRTLDAD